MLFMAMQVLGLKPQMLLDPPLVINPVGISTSRSRTWGHHLGKVQAVLSGSSTGGRTGTMVARSYHDLTQGIEELNIRCGNIEQSTQEIQTTLNTHIEYTTQQHERQDECLATLIDMVRKDQEEMLPYMTSLGYIHS